MGHNYGSFSGKSEILIRIEMDETLKIAGLPVYSSFERKRGRVCLVVKGKEHIEKASALLIERHPDLKFHSENPPQGDTHFVYFQQQ